MSFSCFRTCGRKCTPPRSYELFHDALVHSRPNCSLTLLSSFQLTQAATQQALRDCSGKLWTDPAALTELCRDTLQILAPDMDYVDKSVTESKASQQSRGRRKTPAIASTFDVDDDQDVIETEAKKLALRIAASDRVFSYAHVVRPFAPSHLPFSCTTYCWILDV